MSRVVLDASAVLAMLNEEPGGDEVASTIPGAVLGTVNLSEVIAKLTENGMPEEVVRLAMTAIELEIHPFDEALAYEAGTLRATTKSLGLSFGDRACLALGKRLGLPVLTTDRRWADLKAGFEVRLIR